MLELSNGNKLIFDFVAMYDDSATDDRYKTLGCLKFDDKREVLSL